MLPTILIIGSLNTDLVSTAPRLPAADLLAEAKTSMEQEQFEEAGSLYSALLQEDPENPEAWAGQKDVKKQSQTKNNKKPKISLKKKEEKRENQILTF